MDHNPQANASHKTAPLIKLDRLIQRIHNSGFYCAITANTSNARHYLQALHDSGFVLDSEFRDYSNRINSASSKAIQNIQKKELTNAQ